MESGFSSPRTEAFPAGLRVLVVDDDPTWLKILERMLRKCSYGVTTCGLARVALNMLRERKDGFDIVISDVNMPDMDGFKLLELVGLEMDLPVIMMSVDGETSRVMKGVEHGACDYLLKPVRLKELQNIWQHVYRKKKHDIKDMEGYGNNEDFHMTRNGSEDFDDVHFPIGGEQNFAKKRKDMKNEEDDEQDMSDPGSLKKARVVWSVDLHQKFVNAVNQIGLDKVGPKKILDLMHVPGLTRENVASHLQKYRLYLGRLQKSNGPSNCGTMQPNFSSKSSSGNSGFSSSITIQQTELANHFGYSENKFFIQDVVPDIEGSSNNTVTSLPVTDGKRDLTSVLDGRKLNQFSEVGFSVSFGGMVPDVDSVPFESTMSTQFESVEVPIMQHKQHPEPEKEQGPYLLLEQGCSFLQLHAEQNKVSVDGDTEATYTDYRINHDLRLGLPPGCKVDSFLPVKPDHDTEDLPILTAKNSGLDRNCLERESAYWNSTKNNGLVLTSTYEDWQLCSVQGNGCFENIGPNTMEFFSDNGSTLPIELQNYFYEGSWFNCDDEWDLVEYPILDEGLFIV